MRLLIRKKHLRLIVERALGSDVEVVGFLIGRAVEEGVEVAELVFAENVERSPTRFRIEGEDVYRAIRTAEEKGLEIVGIFHSHPAPPAPSKLDMEGMKLWPVTWLIVDSRTGDYAAWLPSGRLVRIVTRQD